MARADGDQDPRWSIKGFGTLGAVGSSERNADFVTVRYQSEGAGASRRISIKPDSRFGLQLDASLNDRISGVVQVVAQQQANGVLSPRIEWANLRFKLTPDWNLRLGRVALPVLMVSDYRLVGFSNTAVRPPVETYGIIPNTSIDGIDTTWKRQIGEATNSLQVVYGKFYRSYPNAGSVNVPTSWGISDWYEQGPVSLHASYSRPTLTWDDPFSNSFFDGIRQYGEVLQSIPGLQPYAAQTFAVADRYRLKDERSSIVSFGIAYDRDPWVLSAEWLRMTHAGFVPTNTAYYLTAGFRIGAWMPYATYSNLRASDVAQPSLPTAGLPPPLAFAGQQLTDYLQGLLATQDWSQHTAAAGIRWELRSNCDLKMQIEQVNVARGSFGMQVNLGPDFHPGGRYRLLSVALDFVF